MSSPPAPGTTSEAATRRLLIVDAGAASAAMYRRAVDPVGLEADICASGRTALDKLRTQRVAAVFLDLRLPDIDGHALLKEMRTIEGHADTPVVVITSKDYHQDRAEAAKMGVVEYLLKPLKSEEIRAVIGRVGIAIDA